MLGKALVICVSKHRGNTLKIAKEIANVLECEVKRPDEVDLKTLTSYDVVGLGSGIYAFGMDRALKKIIKRFKDGQRKKVFIFSTSADLNGYRYHKGLKKLLEKRSFDIIGEFNCPGAYFGWFFGKKGGVNPDRPNDDDLKRAREFAEGLKQK
ncbi:MAG: flavodoxin domain-containing protein [Fervidobacterium sp.]|jgi:flavodoxin